MGTFEPTANCNPFSSAREIVKNERVSQWYLGYTCCNAYLLNCTFCLQDCSYVFILLGDAKFTKAPTFQFLKCTCYT